MDCTLGLVSLEGKIKSGIDHVNLDLGITNTLYLQVL
jgi:hypothetical protein